MTAATARSVAIATCAAWPEIGPGLSPLVRAFESRGIAVTCLPWQDPDDDRFAKAALVLPLCAWDYAAAPQAFRDWILRIAGAGGRFANPPGLMLWNMDKGYLRDLAGRGVAVPPTVMIDDPSPAALAAMMAERGWGRAVLKPAVGQSGNGVALLDRDRIGDWPRLAGGRYILQPFLPALRDRGEISLIHVRGAFSHAVLRRPAAGEWRANSQYGAAVGKARPDPVTLAAARSALDALPASPAYARVDGCLSPERGFTVTEVELIEPALFLHLWPGKAEGIADLLDPGPDWLASCVAPCPPSA